MRGPENNFQRVLLGTGLTWSDFGKVGWLKINQVYVYEYCYFWRRIERLFLEISYDRSFVDQFVKVVLSFGSFNILTIVVLALGEVQYARNGHYVTTLMHVDTSLPLWAFLDIYGTMKEVKSLGKSSMQ